MSKTINVHLGKEYLDGEHRPIEIELKGLHMAPGFGLGGFFIMLGLFAVAGAIAKLAV